MTMRAKFLVHSVTIQKDCEQLTMHPVTYDNNENASFSKYTPAGKLELTITNENLWGEFKPGDEYYIDFTKA